MEAFFKKYSEAFLTAFALVFAGMLIAFFAWGVIDLSQEINQAVISAPHATLPPAFNLNAAASLNLKNAQ